MAAKPPLDAAALEPLSTLHALSGSLPPSAQAAGPGAHAEGDRFACFGDAEPQI